MIATSAPAHSRRIAATASPWESNTWWAAAAQAARSVRLGVGAIAEEGTVVLDRGLALRTGMTRRLLEATIDGEGASSAVGTNTGPAVPGHRYVGAP